MSCTNVFPITCCPHDCYGRILAMHNVRDILKQWIAHYNRSRPHSSLGPGIPDPNVEKEEVQNNRHCIPKDHRIVAMLLLGGLHHDYQMQRIAACESLRSQIDWDFIFAEDNGLSDSCGSRIRRLLCARTPRHAGSTRWLPFELSRSWRSPALRPGPGSRISSRWILHRDPLLSGGPARGAMSRQSSE